MRAALKHLSMNIMNMKSTTLYVSDLDGTLLLPSGQISKWGRDFLNIAVQRGALFTIASARSYESIMRAIQFKPKLPIIASDGAIIHDAATGEPLIVQDLKSQGLQVIYLMAKSMGLFPMLTSFDGISESFLYAEIPNMGTAWYINERIALKDRRMKKVFSVEPFLEEKILSFLVIDRKEPLEILKQEMCKQMSGDCVIQMQENPNQPGWYWLFAENKNATKGRAVEILANSMKIPLQDVVAFGDELNDLSMLEKVGRFVATANARTVIKQKAQLVLGSCQDDSVMKYLYQELGFLLDAEALRQRA